MMYYTHNTEEKTCHYFHLIMTQTLQAEII